MGQFIVHCAKLWKDNQAELPREKEWVQRHGNMVSSQKINAEYKSTKIHGCPTVLPSACLNPTNQAG